MRCRSLRCRSLLRCHGSIQRAAAWAGLGWLVLHGLTSLSDAAAESLSKHEGWLFLKRLTSLPDSAAEILRKHPSFAEEDEDSDDDDDV